MTFTLKLKPEVEASLRARARAHGVPLEEYLLSVVESAAQPAIGKAEPAVQPTREEAVRRMIVFGEKHHLSLGEPITRILLHEGHRL